MGTEFPQEEKATYNMVDALMEKYTNRFNVPYKQKPLWVFDNNTLTVDVKVRCYDQYENPIDYNPDGDDLLTKRVNIDFILLGANAFS